MNEIGIMQGRLSAPAAKRMQAFPWASWEQEFAHARDCGFATIEWLFESENYKKNPIWTEEGREKIYQKIETTGVQIRSVCADYFMLHPFFRVSEDERLRSIFILNQLIEKASQIGVRVILLPVLEASEITNKKEKAKLLESLREPLSLAKAHGIWIGLETELPAPEYKALVTQGDHPSLGVYYDTGNSTAKGYNIAEDIRILSPYLCGVHIKDRKFKGVSTLLGHGDADFPAFFQSLAEIDYSGLLVLQTAFGEDYLNIAKSHLKIVQNFKDLVL